MIKTERLLLRPWKDEDLLPFAAMNADHRVRQFFPELLTKAESNASARRFEQHFEGKGFCFFAAELRATRAFIGFIGLQTISFMLPSISQLSVEIGWRLAAPYWGKGLATEGASAALRYGFHVLRLQQIVAITVPANTRSRRVMEKIGMQHHQKLDFAHPGLAKEHALSQHVLYTASHPENPIMLQLAVQTRV